MSDKTRKRDLLLPLKSDFEDNERLPVLTKRPQFESKKSMHRINPLGMRVVVRIARDSNVSEGGLYLPEGAKQNAAESLVAEVIEVASALDSHSDEETNVSGIPLGAMVLIPKTAGVRVPWDDDLRIVETKEVLALVDEISIT